MTPSRTNFSTLDVKNEDYQILRTNGKERLLFYVNFVDVHFSKKTTSKL